MHAVNARCRRTYGGLPPTSRRNRTLAAKHYAHRGAPSNQANLGDIDALMNGSELKSALKTGKRVYGTMFVTARTGRWDHTISTVGLDFVIVDNEHAPYSRAETADWISKLSQLGVVPFIRVPIPLSHYVTMAVDAGAQGIIVPNVETVDQVREVVGAAKFQPLKGEAVRRAVDEGVFPSEATRTYLEELNRNNVLVIGIESVPAVERLEELISVPGVDAAFVGPNDLSIQLGVPNKYDDPKFMEAMIHIHETCRAKGVPLVIHLFNHDMAAYWIHKGIHFILYGTDRRALSEGFIADFEALRHVNEGRVNEGMVNEGEVNGGKVTGSEGSKDSAPRTRVKLTVVHSNKGPDS